MHRFIVYQYGKVSSTSIVDALGGLPDSEAFQSHFLGEKAFQQMLRRLMDPSLSDYFYEHSSGQLFNNIAIFRHFQRRESSPDNLTMISLSRAPFDWFRSCITQDIEPHVQTFRLYLANTGAPAASDADAVTRGMEALMLRLQQAVEHFGSIDQLLEGDRFALKDVIETTNREDFQSFMFFLNIFLRPHAWFRTQFSDLLGINIRDMQPLGQGALVHREQWGNSYLLRYEDLDEAFPALLDEEGLGPVKLRRLNDSTKKPFSNELGAAFSTPAAQRLKQVCHSADTRFLGYPLPSEKP